MIEAIAAVLIFGTLIGLVVLLIGVLVYKFWQNFSRYDQTGGYKTHYNHKQYRKGKIPNKFTGEYHQQDR